MRIQDLQLDQVSALRAAMDKYIQAAQVMEREGRALERKAEAAAKALEAYLATVDGARDPDDTVLKALEQTVRQRGAEAERMRRAAEVAADAFNEMLYALMGDNARETACSSAGSPQPIATNTVEAVPQTFEELLGIDKGKQNFASRSEVDSGGEGVPTPSEDLDDLWAQLVMEGDAAPFGRG